jgi:hypothetical protein
MTDSNLRADLSESNIIFIHSALDEAGLTAAAFRVFAHLARRAGKDGCFPSADNMAKTCRLERKTIFAALTELEDMGLIERQKRAGCSTRYTLNPPSRWVAKRVDPFGLPGSQTGQGLVGQTGQEVTRLAYHEGNPLKDIQEGNPSLIEVPPATPVLKSKNVPRQIKMERPSLESVLAFVKTLGLPASDGESCYYKWEANDWTNNNKPIRNWAATLRSWKAAGFLPSQRAAGPHRSFGGPTQSPQKKEERAPDQLADLLATVRLLYPNASPVPWAELPLNIRREAEAALASTLVLS